MFKSGDTGGQGSSVTDKFIPGMLTMWGGATVPLGFLLCDGTAVNRLTYATLFAVIGTSFGAGDGSTTFNVPDLRSRSPIGFGQGTGLSNYAMGASGGEESHVLTANENGVHSHSVTDPGHNHTQNAHTHTVTDPGHTHTQNAHTHTQDAHTHTQDAHTHTVTDPGHSHSTSFLTANSASGSHARQLTANNNESGIYNYNTSSVTTGISNANTTATNQNTTATNQNATATNNSNTTGVSNANATATNNSNTTGLSVDSSGLGNAHNTLHPYLAINFIIKH